MVEKHFLFSTCICYCCIIQHPLNEWLKQQPFGLASAGQFYGLCQAWPASAGLTKWLWSASRLAGNELV